jgi:hypothetical protein
MRKLLKILGVLIGILLVGFGALLAACVHSMPKDGVSGPEADAFAREIQKTVHADDFAKIGAVRFTFKGSSHVHTILWDRVRNLARVTWNDNKALVRMDKAEGKAWKGERALEGDEAKKTIETAWKIFINDTFWLNPVPKWFDEGTTRKKVTVDGKPALMVQYASGGATPGDTYVWLLDEKNHPRAWRIWVSVVKIPGLELSWENWTTIRGGAEISQDHKVLGLKQVRIYDLTAAAKLDELETPDPFASM